VSQPGKLNMIDCRTWPSSQGKHVLQGRTPENEDTVALFHLLSQANVDLRQPVSLEEQLMEDRELDADVGLAMVSLLKVTSSTCLGHTKHDQALEAPLLIPEHFRGLSKPMYSSHSHIFCRSFSGSESLTLLAYFWKLPQDFEFAVQIAKCFVAVATMYELKKNAKQHH